MKEELIKITTNENGVQCVSARELHEFLEIGKVFGAWINDMIGYGFEENVDYTTYWSDSKNGNAVEYLGSPQKMSARGYTKEYIITIDMAKELSMIQRTEKGKQARLYFIECEKKLKTQVPQLTEEQKLALLVFEGGFSAVEASKKMVELQTKPLLETIETQKPKVEYVDKFMNGDGLFLISEIAKKVGITAVRANNILKENKIIYKNGKKYYPYAKTPKDWYGYQESVGKDGAVYSQLKWTSKGVYEITKILEDNQ